jgi:HK97 family phage portal protein
MATSLRSPAKWLLDLFGSGSSGVNVTPTSMLGSPAVWYAINSISADVAKLPLQLLKEDADGGKEVQKKAPSHRLLTQEPNEWQTADLFKEQMMSHALAWGDGRAVVRRVGTRPVEFLPMDPARTETVMVKGTKYHVILPDEDDPIEFRSLTEHGRVDELIAANEKVLVFHDHDILHIPGFGYNGVNGLSVAKVLRNSLSIDLQAQKYAANGMENGFSGEVMLEAPAGVFRDQDDAELFLKHFRKSMSRGQDGEAIGLLREGIKATQMNMSLTDSQFLEQREFSRQDVMLIFGLQHIPGDSSATSYNSLEQKQLAYLAGCLDRWLVRWEMQCDMKLRSAAEKRSNTLRHVFDRTSLLRTDAQTQQEVLSGLISSTIMNRNEARGVIGLNPVEGGDEFLNPFTTSDWDEEEESDGEEVEETETNDGGGVIEDRLNYLVSLESSRIVEMSGRKDFLDSLDNFYTKWAVTLLNNAIPADTVKALTEEHKNGLLELAGKTSSDGKLQSSVAEYTETW